MKILDWLEDFFFKYFSSSTADSKDFWVRYVVMSVMLTLVLMGLLCTISGFYDLARFFGWVLMAILVPFGALWIIVYFYHNWKTKKLNNKWR